MDADIRKYIIENFKDDNINELEETINESINEGLEEALPGLGVFFEIVWKNSNQKQKKELLDILKAHLN